MKRTGSQGGTVRRRGFGVLAALALSAMVPGAAMAQAPSFTPSGDDGFDAWRSDFAARAIAGGRQASVVKALLDKASPDPTIIKHDRSQAEFVSPPWVYMNSVVSPQRVTAGIQKKADNALLFSQVGGKFGVDPDIVAGIWAIETNFGGASLNYDAGEALATLAYDTRRRAQFERYLLALIQMVERGYAGPAELKSSWAGALGQPQFMPDVYLTTAYDWDGDGKRDIWNNTGDILGSIANYLAQHGWRPSAPVFWEVALPPGFNYAMADNSPHVLSEWAGLGVKGVDDNPWPQALMGENAKLFLPAGYQGPALLLFNNFDVIKTYNNSDRYALAVALLARGFQGQDGLKARWPTQLTPLDQQDTAALQESLTRLGYAAGEADGMFGSATRRAVRAFQPPIHCPPTAIRRANCSRKCAPSIRRRARRRRFRRRAPLCSRRSGPAPASSAWRAFVQLQRTLVALGYKLGKPDGKVGPKTRQAIMAEERRLGLRATGVANAFILAQTRKRVAGR